MKLPTKVSFGRKALRYFRDPAVARWRKYVGVGAVAYALLPTDLVPDFIPVLGWLDDVGVLSAVSAFLFRDIRRHRE